MKIEIKEIYVKSLTKTKIPGYDFSLNPYIGCVFGCRFCYVRKFLPYHWKINKEWGYFLYPKVNLPLLVRKNKEALLNKKILVSPSTDPYPPQEKIYKITRRILEELSTIPVRLSILTRSDLVLRDLDLLKRFQNVEVGFSISTNIDEIKKHIEPRTPSLKRRIEAIKILKKTGIRTYAFFAPLFPVDVKLLEKDLFPYVDEILIDPINYPSLNYSWLKSLGFEFVFDESFQKKMGNEIFKSFLRVKKCASVQ